MFNGYGTCYYFNGDVYTGNFKDGYYSGEGTYAYNTGDRYSGTFLNNVFNGEGVYIDENGVETTTMYVNGRAVGESKVVDKSPVEPTADTKQPESKTEKEKQTQPVAKIKCTVCGGKGKIFQPEVKRSRSVVKDISNGIGPRNFVTYSVMEVVKPAAYATCKACGGSGYK